MSAYMRRKPVTGTDYLPVSTLGRDPFPRENEDLASSIVSSLHETTGGDISGYQTPEPPKVVSFVNYQETTADDNFTYVSWGVYWQKPVLIAFMLVASIGLSLAHHFYYQSLNNQKAGDTDKQAWATRIGTFLAILVAFFLKTGTAIVLGQYVWTVVRRRAFTMENLDSLFSLSSDPLGYVRFDLLRHAPLALFLGIVLWCLQITSIAPPATLTVVARNISREGFVPILDSSLPTWNAQKTDIYEATEVTNVLAQQAATVIDVVPLSNPVSSSGWSYRVQFFGPTLQCNIANSTEQRVFDNVTQTFESQNDTWTFSGMTSKNFTGVSKKLVWSSWCYWCPSTTPNTWSPTVLSYGTVYKPYVTPQLWVQTATSGIVCNSVNATFDVTVSSIGGRQEVIQNSVTILGTYNTPYISISDSEVTAATSTSISAKGGERSVKWSPFFAHLYAMGALLSGTISLVDSTRADDASNPRWVTSGSSNLIFTGLLACNEIANSPWKNVTSLVISDRASAAKAYENTFPAQSWMCRNQTLAAGIQDLANNVTISYLSSQALSNFTTVSQLIETSDTDNFYQYHPLYLVVSYGVGLFFAAFAALVGFYALYVNGVSHSTSFSAFVATTRNPELDLLLKGASLAADPMKTDVEETKLRFGALMSGRGEIKSATVDQGLVGGSHEAPHVAFGFEGNVATLKKGGLYR